MHRSALAARARCSGGYDLQEVTLADRERVLGPDHLDTLTSRNNLAGAYEAAGQMDKGIPPTCGRTTRTARGRRCRMR